MSVNLSYPEKILVGPLAIWRSSKGGSLVLVALLNHWVLILFLFLCFNIPKCDYVWK